MISFPMKWLFHWEYTLFSDTAIWKIPGNILDLLIIPEEIAIDFLHLDAGSTNFHGGFGVLKIQQQVARTSAGMMPDRSAGMMLK